VGVTGGAAALPADRVNLVNKDDAASVLASRLEQVADARGPDADVHLDEVRARCAEERHASFTGHGAGQQGLAVAGRAHQEDAARDARTDC
jgi:hypothetical protein